MKGYKKIEARHYATGRVLRLSIESGIIQGIDILEGSGKFPYIAPGLCDLQVNGYKGIDFNSPELTQEGFKEVLPALAEEGITSFFPTLITGDSNRITAALKVISGLMAEGDEMSKLVGGIHLEGPFISTVDGPRGAHPLKHCKHPDTELVKRWQEAAGGNIRILTLAPELPGSMELIRLGRELGMLVAIGHTAAGTDDIRLAVEAGATLSTHLGNGSHAVLPRHPNYIWEQLANDRLYASMMADGFHLGDAVLKVFARTKGEKGILVSDSMCQAGLEPGDYDSPATGRVRLSPEGKLHMAGNPALLAGSASSLLKGVRHMARLTGFAAAWDMGSIHPLSLMNHIQPAGLEVGAPADLVLLDSLEDARVVEVYKNGNSIYKAL